MPLSCAGAEKISELIGEASEPGFIKRRFLRALSCKGRVRLAGTLRELCSRIVMLSDEGLEQTARLAEESGLSAIVCPQPLRPDKLDAVLLPGSSLGARALRASKTRPKTNTLPCSMSCWTQPAPSLTRPRACTMSLSASTARIWTLPR